MMSYVPDFLGHTFFAFFALFPILNPPAMAPIFLALTEAVPDKQRNRLSMLIGTYTFIFLSILLVAGGWLLKILGISVPVIAIAGGLLVFHSAWRMLNKESHMTDSEQEEIRSSMLDKAFFPLTMPVTAGPGAMAVTLSLVPRGSIWRSETLLTFLAVMLGIALAAFTVFIFYRYSAAFIRKMGKTGAAAFNQISAFVLLAIGVQIVWSGLKELILSLH